jgi:hypothetical protein
VAARYLRRAEGALDAGLEMSIDKGKSWPLTIVAGIVVLVALSRPQIHRIPSFAWPTRADWVYPTLFILYLLSMVALLVVALWVMVRSRTAASRRLTRLELDSGIAGFWRARVTGFVDGIDRVAEQVEAKLGKRGRSVAGWGALVFGPVWLYFPELVEVPPWVGSLPFRVLPCVVGVGMAFFFLTGKGMDPQRRSASQRYFVLMCTSLAFGELLWLAPDWLPGVFSFRMYSVWAIAFLTFAILATSMLAEIAFRDWIARAACALLAIGYLCQAAGTFVRPAEASTAAPAPRQDPWFEQLEQRISASHPDYSVLFVAASGGGSRAALYAALVLEALDHTLIGDDSESRTLAENVVLISGVSGGSLATAYYMHRASDRAGTCAVAEHPKTQPGREPTLNYTQSTVVEQMKAILHSHAPDTAGHGGLDAAAVDAYEQVRQQVLALPNRPATSAKWLFESSFVDDMATDFMAPLLRGVLTPLLERGDSVATFWQTRFGWSGCSQRPVQPFGNVPVIALNATDVASGKRVVLGFPPVPSELLGPQFTSLGTDVGSAGLRLSDGVRISANFPWGFDLPDVPAPGGEPGPAELRLIDGGVLDNTGIDTITEVLRGIARLSSGKPLARDAGNEPSPQLVTQAQRIRDALARRGVLLLEIDSGAKPSPSPILSVVAPAISEPLDALSWAGFGNANSIKQSHLLAMRGAVSEMIESTTQGGVVEPELAVGHVPFVCNRQDDVMTAWALGTEDKAKLFVMFLLEWVRQLPELQARLAMPARARAELELAALGDSEATLHAGTIFGEIVSQTEQAAQRSVVDAATRQEAYTQLVRDEPSPARASEAGDSAGAPSPKQADNTGYLYIGHLAKQRWTVRYVSFPEGKAVQQLAAGDTVVTTGNVNVRTAKPTAQGRFGRVVATLPPGSKVRVTGPAERWRTTGYHYVPIEY